MTPERWQEIQRHLEGLLTLEPVAQSARIQELSSEDPDLAAELGSLLSAQSASSEFLQTSALRALWQQSAEHETMCGRRLGRYRIEELLGVGGMGDVYRAVRDDDQYQQRVAIKFVRAGSPGPILMRFRNERQILAGLEHPNIAHLIDGGTSDDGSPYLVMELVEGQPIDAYCDNRHASITDRLTLFLQVCSAVQYAHRRLIVHRDLKPNNILVTADGVPKLLDFGIAKILSPELSAGPQATKAFIRLLTPGYASPEQITGAPITTASDVYSLGVVLYELLTGHHPLGPGGRTRTVVDLASDFVPERPSTVVWRRETLGPPANKEISPLTVSTARACSPAKLAKRLRGDLDNIVLYALRTEPERRYESVEQFTEDIRRHLTDRPVSAHRDALRYRAAKFISRHKAGVAAGALVSISLLAGVVAVLHESRVVRAEKLRADRRFNDVRNLAHALLFEDHDAIENLPGSTTARKLIVSQSLDYLGRLSGEAAGDAGLQRELADAYERVGRIQGNPLESNLGDPKGALASLSSALAINQTLVRAHPGDLDSGLGVARVLREISMIRLRSLGDVTGAIDDLQRALEIAGRLHTAAPKNVSVISELASDHRGLGVALGGGNAVAAGSGDINAALQEDSQSLAYSEQAAKMRPEDLSLQGNLVGAGERVADDLIQAGKRSEALRRFEAADQLTTSLLRTDPTNAYLGGQHSIISTRIGEVLCMGGKFKEALPFFQAGLGAAERLIASDAHNQQLGILLADALLGVGYSLSHAGNVAEGFRYFNRLRALLEQQIARYPNVIARTLLAMSHVFMGEAAFRSHQPARALTHYEEARAITEVIVAGSSNDNAHRLMLAGIHNAIAAAYLKSGKVEPARQEYQLALQLNEPIAARVPSNLEAKYSLVNTNAGLGDVAAVLARRLSGARAREHWDDACRFYSKSLTLFQAIEEPAFASPGFFQAADRNEVSKHLRECQAKLAT